MKIVTILTLAISFLARNPVEASVKEQIKESIDDVSHFLKKEVDQLGDDLNAIQHYLDNYHWKGVIQDRATSGPATLSNLTLNGHSRVAVVKPGELIAGEVDYSLNTKEAAFFKVYREVIGIKGEGPQVAIGTTLGIAAGEGHERFMLAAPLKAGFYQIRFRTADSCFITSALNSWIDGEGKEPDGTTTIGVIYVQP